MGRSRDGFGTKIHLATDGVGHPLAVVVTAGQEMESTHLPALLDRVAVPRAGTRAVSRPLAVAGDKGYSSRVIRRYLRCRGLRAVIPWPCNQRATRRWPLPHDLYQRRNVIERRVARLKEHRRVATRYEKWAAAYEAKVILAMVRLWLRELPDRA